MTTAEACQLVVELTHQLSATCSERDAYRLLAQQTIHALHGLTCDRDRLRERHHALLAEYRALRQHVMREAVAA